VKICNRCKTTKPFSKFSKNSREKDHLCRECKDCAKVRAKLRYQKQGQKMRQQMADLRKNNYDKRIEIERKSRTKRKNAQRPLKNSRQQIRNRLLSNKQYVLTSKELNNLYKKPCYSCGTNQNLSIDHIIPLSKGGNHSIGNLMTLCRSCNASKGNKLLVEWKKYLQTVRGDQNRTLRIFR